MSSSRSESHGLSRTFHAGGVYMFTQLFKMLILTFFPETISSDANGSDFNLNGFLKCSAGKIEIFSSVLLPTYIENFTDLLDYIGLAWSLSKIPGKGHTKLLTAACGWASAEIILSKGLVLWQARKAEFSWMYTQKALESNIILINIVAVTTLLWLFSRNRFAKKSMSPIVTFLLFAIAFRSFWLDGILFAFNVGPWSSLFLKGATSVFAFGLPTVYLYSISNTG